MPILSFQEIEPIDMRKMEKDISGFRVPISYMFIDDKPELFEYIEHNFNVSKWDTSNVKNMSYMFYRCYKFTGKGIGNWNVSNVKDIGGMFAGCEKFDCDLSNWDVSNVTDMNYVFIDCEKFKGKGLENWNVTNVTNMRRMFDGCNKLTIPNWYK